MNGYRSDSGARCEMCGGSRRALDYDNEGRLLCQPCAARATVKTLDEQREADERLDKLLESAQSAVEQAVDDAIEQQDQAIRRCPKCGPTMVGTQQRHVGASSLSNVSGVTYEGKFTCRNCGRTASIFPAAPAAARAVLVLVLLIAIPFVSSPVVYMIAGLASVFGMFALADLIQRRRFPIVKRP